ncbi:hypothetical protein TSOC_004064 [Tetrabaena socialis]|uniref:Uncharacterized protein n=1 Tax=Tetrabaena socialis TaxID=47790 RepID=A0A2J8A9Z0_9CHLO|nr:hypothetical protein TSOC_004064 [Tetrabaena socialis]|eukprot:PNH09315.1 hypothetical protein TSOC_004064 [Tetrabaena socialis]
MAVAALGHTYTHNLRFRHIGATEALCAAATRAASATGGLLPEGRQRTNGRGPASAIPSLAAVPTPFTAAVAVGAEPPPYAARLCAGDLVTVLWACGRLQHTDKQLMAVAEERLLPAVPSLDPWALATLASSLAALDRHSNRLFAAICRGAAAHVGSGAMGPAPMVALVGALGRTEHYDAGLVDAVAGRLVAGGVRQLQAREVSRAVHRNHLTDYNLGTWVKVFMARMVLAALPPDLSLHVSDHDVSRSQAGPRPAFQHVIADPRTHAMPHGGHSAHTRLAHHNSAGRARVRTHSAVPCRVPSRPGAAARRF